MKSIVRKKKFLSLVFFLCVTLTPGMTQIPDDEIVFYTNDSVFAPLITLSGPAEVLWTWADNTTSNSLNPEKVYPSDALRPNRLKVTPWSAVEMINIGYDAGDGGKPDIPFVADQKVSEVVNMSLAASSLKYWCSSYNRIKSLDFSNFIYLERIECFRSDSLRSVNLSNTPKLWRVCLEDNDLSALDLSGSPVVTDLRAALNDYNEIIFSTSTEEFYHLCVRDNHFIANEIFTDMTSFPYIGELFIWRTNQSGTLRIPSTHPTDDIDIRAYENNYTALDLRGSLKNQGTRADIDLSGNQLTDVRIAGCNQISMLILKDNKLDSAMVDTILKTLDSFATDDGIVDLTSNHHPSYMGLQWKQNLESRGWQVAVDPGTWIPTAIEEERTDDIQLYPNPADRILRIRIPEVFSGIRELYVHDMQGRLLSLNKLAQSGEEGILFPVEHLAAGTYLFRFRLGNRFITHEVIVTH